MGQKRLQTTDLNHIAYCHANTSRARD